MNKRRFKFNYYDGARTQTDVLWGQVVAMDESPPGTPYHDEPNIGKGPADTHERREAKGPGHKHHTDNLWIIAMRKEPDGCDEGQEDSCYTTDSARWDVEL